MYDFNKNADPYKLLGVKPSDKTADMRIAYLARVKENHPDRFTDDSEKQKATERLKEINAAWEKIKRGFSGVNVNHGRRTTSDSNENSDFEDISDFNDFENMEEEFFNIFNPIFTEEGKYYYFHKGRRYPFKVEKNWYEILWDVMESPEGARLLQERDELIDSIRFHTKRSKTKAISGISMLFCVPLTQIFSAITPVSAVMGPAGIPLAATIIGGGLVISAVFQKGKTDYVPFKVAKIDCKINELMVEKFKSKDWAKDGAKEARPVSPLKLAAE